MNLRRNKEKLIKTVICVVSLLVCLLGIYNISKNVKEYRSLNHEKGNLESQVIAAKEEFEEHKKAVQEIAYEEAKESDNEEVKQVAVHNNSYLIMNNLSQSFFKEYFTWNDSKTYRERAEKVSSVATKEIRDNKEIFDDGKDSLGGDYVKITGVKSEFINATAYPVDDKNSLVRVTYRSWFNDAKSRSADATRYYYVTFNRDNQKISNLELVFSSEK